MAIIKLNIDEFLELKCRAPVLDVRSPGEYQQAHIPGAVSFPLFTNAERQVVGTAYKQQSREQAIKIGLETFGKNMVAMVEQAEHILASHPGKGREIGLHCWRGGMRSAAVAWLLDLYGFKVYTLHGGYKTYRRWVLQQFEKPWQFRVIGGYTGSNKTGIIQELKRRGECAIDLEELAGHKGSAFGNLDRETQPSQELFENLLGTVLAAHTTEQPIWLEDESQRIGSINIPPAFFKTMRTQPCIFMEVPFDQRLQYLLVQYGKFDKEKFINGIIRIKKRLGGLEAKQAVNFLLEEDLKGCFTVLLKYYDKIYKRNRFLIREEEQKITTLPLDGTDAVLNAKHLIHHVSNT